MSCENEKCKWHLNSIFPCHRKTVGTKVHAFSLITISKLYLWKTELMRCLLQPIETQLMKCWILERGGCYLPIFWRNTKRSLLRSQSKFSINSLSSPPVSSDKQVLLQRRRKETKSNIILKKDIFFSSTYGRLSLRLFHWV